jgi:TonB-linked SusC/RagA family outer membrane protein
MKIKTLLQPFIVRNKHIKRIFRIMKLSVIFLFAFTLQLMAIGTEAQNATIKIKSNLVTITQLINEIEKQTNYLVIFSNKEVNVQKEVQLQSKSNKVSSYLAQALSGTDLGYEVENNYIILAKKSKIMAIAQRNDKITGIVVDSRGDPIIGANVRVKGSTNGTISDINGKFILHDVKKGDFIEVSYIGYITQIVEVVSGKSLSISMAEDTKRLGEVVVVGYGIQKVATITGSVAQIKSDKLTAAPIGDVKNILGGQLPGLVTKLNTGLPGANNIALRIRGYSNSPLIIVDGVESDFSNIDANQIESISILKDASASIYGARAGDGVILITTKRGNNSKLLVSIGSSYTTQGILNAVKPSTSAQRALWERDAYLNSGKIESQVPYSLEDVQKYEDGTDPVHYPNTDWWGATLRNNAPQWNHTISIRGGSDRLKYYGYFGYNKQETLIKHDGGEYSRYNIQMNVDSKITDRLTLSVNMMYTKEKTYYCAQGDTPNHVNFWNMMYYSDPRYPLSLPDETKYSYCKVDYGNPLVASSTRLGGYQENQQSTIRINGTIKYDFKYIDGLNAKAFFGFTNDDPFIKRFIKGSDSFYTYNPDTESYSFIRKSLDPTSLTESTSRNPEMTQQFSLNYEKTLFGKHNINAMVLFEMIRLNNKYFTTARKDFMSTALDQMFAGNPTTATNGSYEYNLGRASWVGRLNYNYSDRYLVELILRADASSKFDKSSRWGYFPSVSLGWVVSNEPFFKKLNCIDNLKVRLSYGKTGNDNVSPFAYLTGFTVGQTYQLGDNIISGLTPTGLANPNMTWEKMNIYNGGLDFSLWKRKLYGNADVFYRLRDGIPGNRVNSLPTTFGATLPTENINSIKTIGFELNLGTSGRFGDFSYDISSNISWSRSKWKHFDEPAFTDPDWERINKCSGQWIDRRFGYISDGLFTSQDEINSLDFIYEDLGSNSSLRPGDIKYVDRNEDGKLNWRDMVDLGKGTMPHWMYGLNLNLKYKDFDLSALFQGAWGYTTYIRFNETFSKACEQRWIESTNDAKALYPRIGGSGPWYMSNYWLHNTSYLRLKYLSIGYNLPKEILAKLGIRMARVYCAGTNLFTLSSLHKYGVDPEIPEEWQGNNYLQSCYYPLQYTLSFGINLTF